MSRTNPKYVGRKPSLILTPAGLMRVKPSLVEIVTAQKNPAAVFLGKKGGLASMAKYGREKYVEMGKKGKDKRWPKKLSPESTEPL